MANEEKTLSVFSLLPVYSKAAYEAAQVADNGDAVLAFDPDRDDCTAMRVGDVFLNRDDALLYKAVSITADVSSDDLVVRATCDFLLSPTEFSVVMDEIAEMDCAERRHVAADAVMAHTFKRVAPDYASAVDRFESMGKWYS